MHMQERILMFDSIYREICTKPIYISEPSARYFTVNNVSTYLYQIIIPGRSSFKIIYILSYFLEPCGRATLTPQISHKITTSSTRIIIRDVYSSMAAYFTIMSNTHLIGVPNKETTLSLTPPNLAI